MCRNIKTLFNFDPPATDEEIRAASLQFVRKLSGFNAPSKHNEEVFNRSVEEVSQVARNLVYGLVTGPSKPPRPRRAPPNATATGPDPSAAAGLRRASSRRGPTASELGSLED